MTDSTPRIVSLGQAVPDQPYNCVVSMEEWCRMLGYKSHITFDIARNTQISLHRWWANPIGKSVQELSEDYIAGGVALSCRAIEDCLDRPVQEFGSFIFVSTTQQLEVCPGMSFRIAGKLGMPEDIKLVDIISDGCQGLAPGLETAYSHLLTFRKPVLVVSCEICSSTYFPAPENDIANSVANLIFNDGACAMILDNSKDAQFPAILDFERSFTPEGLGLLGYTYRDNRMKVILHKDVRTRIPPLIARVVQRLLERNGLTKEDVGNWVFHNGGVAVLNETAAVLGLDSQRDLRYSWEILREFGNVSSATAGMVAKRMHENPMNRDGYILGCTMGAGGQVGGALLRYG